MKRLTTVMAWLNAGLVGVIAVIAFTISYSALRETALAFGITGFLSWLWPLLIDLSLVVFTLSYLVAHVTNNDTRFPVAMIATYTVATIGFNLVHSDPELLPARWVSYIVAIVAPVSLFFTTESLAQQFKAYVSRHANVMIDTLPAYQFPTVTTFELPVNDRDSQNSLNEQAESEQLDSLAQARQVKSDMAEELTVKIHQLTQAGLNRQDIANELDCSLSTVTRHRRLAREAGLNGRQP